MFLLRPRRELNENSMPIWKRSARFFALVLPVLCLAPFSHAQWSCYEYEIEATFEMDRNNPEHDWLCDNEENILLICEQRSGQDRKYNQYNDAIGATWCTAGDWVETENGITFTSGALRDWTPSSHFESRNTKGEEELAFAFSRLRPRPGEPGCVTKDTGTRPVTVALTWRLAGQSSMDTPLRCRPN